MARRDRDRRGGRDERWDDGAWRGSRDGGHRQDRRRRERGNRQEAEPALPPPPPLVVAREPLPPVCGSCREWFSHETGGRGACDHPGSGFFAPWSDTPACQFFVPRR